MLVLFDQSARRNGLPLGTGNKTERMLGYFTWHADDTPPLNPIGDLFKTQVWALAEHLGVPEQLIRKAPSADLEANQTDEGDMGISYSPGRPHPRPRPVRLPRRADRRTGLHRRRSCGRAPARRRYALESATCRPPRSFPRPRSASVVPAPRRFLALELIAPRSSDSWSRGEAGVQYRGTEPSLIRRFFDLQKSGSIYSDLSELLAHVVRDDRRCRPRGAQPYRKRAARPASRTLGSIRSTPRARSATRCPTCVTTMAKRGRSKTRRSIRSLLRKRWNTFRIPASISA